MSAAVSPAPGPVQGPPPGFWASVPARGLLVAVTILLLLALAGLAAWIWWLRQPPVIEKIIPQPAAQLSPETQAKARSLTEESELLLKKLTELRSMTVTCPPGQRIRLGSNTPPATAPGALPVTPATVTPADTGPLKVLPTADLATRLEGATALVLTEKSIATGFFIAPDLLMTNRHAVEDAKGGKVYLASRSLGGARPGQVLRASPPGNPGSADFALVRLLQGSAPAVLPLTDQSPKLAPVVAAGYPGLTLMADSGFRKLAAGDASAAPDLNLTQGVVQSLQTSPQGVPVVLHTASILQGNSGGPLVDTCGRVIGINTFIAVDAEQSGRVSYAQTAGAVSRFMAESGARLGLDARLCPVN